MTEPTSASPEAGGTSRRRLVLATALVCARPATLDLVIPGEGHPNGKLNALWARCVSRRIPLAELAR